MEKLLKQFLEKGVLSSACEVEQEIRVGAGGASLWALREGARRYVLKAAQGEALPSVAKELAFYRLAARLSLPNVPALRWGGQAEDAVFLLMDFHTPVAQRPGPAGHGALRPASQPAPCPAGPPGPLLLPLRH